MFTTTFRRLALIGAAAFALTGGSAFGAIVNYYTVGTFGNNSNTITFNNGGPNLTLTYGAIGTPAAPATVDPSQSSFASFGTITTNNTSMTGVSGSTPFTLQIFQTVPSSANGSLVGQISGSVAFNSSTMTLTVPNTTINLGGVLYSYAGGTPQGNNLVIGLVPPSTNGGVTTLQGNVVIANVPTNVPEPASMALVGGGLLAAGLYSRRRMSRV